MRSSYAKAKRRKNCRPTVVIRVFALAPHQDAPRSAITLHVAFKRVEIKHLLEGKLLRAFLVCFGQRHGKLEPVRKDSFVRCDWKVIELAYDCKKCPIYNRTWILLNVNKLHTTIRFIEMVIVHTV